MKIVKIDGLKTKLQDLDYTTIKEEMERCEKKGKLKTSLHILNYLKI